MMDQRGPPGAPRANGDGEGGPGKAWPSHCLPQGPMGSGGIHFMQHPPHMQPVYYQVAPRPAVYPGMGAFLPGPVPAHAGGLFPLGPGRLPPAGQAPEGERPSGWGGAPLGQREGSTERQYSGHIELPGSLGSSPVASTYLNNGAFRGPFDEASSAPPASQGGAAGGHSGRHRSRDEDSATPCPFYMKTGTCAYGDICKFFHPSTIPPVLFNSIGLPLRPGEPNCRFYMQTMRCDYGPSCKYNHPEPCHAAGPAWRPPAMSWGPHMQLPVPGNGWRPLGVGHGPHAAGGGALGPGLEPRRSNGGGHGGLRALRGSRPQPQSPAASAASIAAATAAAAAAAAAAQKGLPGGGAAAASAESSSVDAESVASVSQPTADRPAARLAAEATAAGQVAQRRSEQEREGGERGVAEAGAGAVEGMESADDAQKAAGDDAASAALRPQSEPRPAGVREASPGQAQVEPAGDAPAAEAGAAAAEELAEGASRLKLSDD